MYLYCIYNVVLICILPISALSPELHGLPNSLQIATKGTLGNGGVKVWINDDYYFTDLPDYLKGVNFFRICYYDLSCVKTSSLNIRIYHPSTIYIARHLTAYGGGIINNLTHNGWAKTPGAAGTSWYPLNTILTKTFLGHGPKTIQLGAVNEPMVIVIFVKRKTLT